MYTLNIIKSMKNMSTNHIRDFINELDFLKKLEKRKIIVAR